MSPLMHDTARRWLSGLNGPKHPAARMAWITASLMLRARRRLYEGTSRDLKASMARTALVVRLTKIDPDWIHIIGVLVEGYKLRKDSIQNHVRRYKLEKQGGGK